MLAFSIGHTTCFFVQFWIENLHNTVQYGNSSESGTISSHVSRPLGELTSSGVTALCSPGEPSLARGLSPLSPRRDGAEKGQQAKD